MKELDPRSLKFLQRILPEGTSWNDLPLLQHKKHFVGNTDYIDSVKPSDLQHRVSRSVDQYNRPYIAILYKGNVQVVFKRYTDPEDPIWTFGGHYIPNPHEVLLLNQNSSQLQNNSTNILKIQRAVGELLTSNNLSL